MNKSCFVRNYITELFCKFLNIDYTKIECKKLEINVKKYKLIFDEPIIENLTERDELYNIIYPNPTKWFLLNDFPVYECSDSELITQNGNNIYFARNFLFSLLSILNRVNDYTSLRKDKFGRPVNETNIPFLFDLYRTPFVDIFFNKLKKILNIFYDVKVKTFLSCDLDRPFLFKRAPFKVILSYLKNLQICNSLIHLYNLPFVFFSEVKDPFIKGVCDVFTPDADIKILYIMFSSSTDKDYGYNIHDISKYIKRDDLKIGFHPSFYTENNYNTFYNELNQYIKFTSLKTIYIRSHYLKNNISNIFEFAKLNNDIKFVDSSFCFYNDVGYISGTSTQYKLIDPSLKIDAQVFEIPTIVMDSSLLLLNNREKVLKSLSNQICSEGGFKHILWHNSSFVDQWRPLKSKYNEYISTFFKNNKSS